MQSAGSLEALIVVADADVGRVERWMRLSAPFMRFVVASNTAEAAARLARERIDAVLIDATAAGRDDPEAVHRLVALARGRPVLLIGPAGSDGAMVATTALAAQLGIGAVRDGGPIDVLRALRQLVVQCRRHDDERHRDRLDSLTGLMRREAFMSEVAARLARAIAPSSTIVVDIDGLGAVNALVGRDTADRVLAMLADRLTGAIEPGDLIGVGAGGTFLCWTALSAAPEEALVRTRRLLDVVARPLVCAGRQMQLTAAAGLAFHPSDAVGIETLVARAEAAMHRAKAAGPNTYRVHQPLVIGAAPAQLSKRAAVRRELEREALELIFEPQLDLAAERPRAARVRLRTRLSGAALPLAADEMDDLAVPMIRWMLDTAGAQMTSWLARDVPLVPLVVDLPLSLVQRRDVIDMVHGRLRSVGCHPAWFEVAVRGEPGIVSTTDTATADNLQALRDLGLRITLGDCGGVGSSFAMLRHLPADGIELAAELVLGQRERASDATVLRAIVDLALGLGLEVGAAGVDRPSLARELRGFGCDWASGPWVGPPVTATAFSDWLAGAGAGGGTAMVAAS